MRDIKFRAWDKKQKRFGYLDLSSSDFGDPSYFNDTLQQFTGLLDENGVEIYEGDIVQLCLQGYGIDLPNVTVSDVVYKYGGFQFNNNKKILDVEQYIQSLMYQYEILVIGNIYQNEDLL